MYTKEIKYTDYNGVEKTKTCMFNISKAEIIEMQYSEDGGLDQRLSRIINAVDNKEIMKEFKNFIMLAYGEKSADGDRFIKSREISEAFTQTEAYSELFMELCLNEDAAGDFINKVLPNDEEIKKAVAIAKERAKKQSQN